MPLYISELEKKMSTHNIIPGIFDINKLYVLQFLNGTVFIVGSYKGICFQFIQQMKHYKPHGIDIIIIALYRIFCRRNLIAFSRKNIFADDKVNLYTFYRWF